MEKEMIPYTCVGTNDLDRATAFYSEIFAIFGARIFFRVDRAVFWGVSPDKPMFSLMKPFDEKPATVGNGSMVALSAADPDQVRAVHAKALELGAPCEGEPGERGSYGFYAYFRELDGNKIAVRYHA